ncbi:MAG: type 4a pilus biogenesis protein PilO [Actinomycetota bacterium]|nr:type 4a pilus biogenesis protein PilO [Actinomycetota bacterium]
MRRAPLILAVLGAVLVTAVWYLFVISPMNQRIGELRAELETARTEETTLRATLAQLKEVQESELAYISAVGALETMIPPNPDLADLFDQLNVLKTEAGIEWLSFTPGIPTAPGAEVEEEVSYLEIPTSINIEGQYFEVLGYLYGLAEIDRLVVVDAVDISSRENEDGLTVLSVSLAASIFTTGSLGPLSEQEGAPTEVIEDEVPEEAPVTSTTTPGGATTTVPVTTITSPGGP